MNKQKRYRYYTIGYGVASLLGEIYRMGRVEIYDREEDSGYASSEGTYCMPYDTAAKFEDWINSLETDYPIQISMGSVDECALVVSEELKIPVNKLNDLDIKKQYYKKKYSK